MYVCMYVYMYMYIYIDINAGAGAAAKVFRISRRITWCTEHLQTKNLIGLTKKIPALALLESTCLPKV